MQKTTKYKVDPIETKSPIAVPAMIDPEDGDLLIGTIWQQAKDLTTQIRILKRAIQSRSSIEDELFIEALELMIEWNDRTIDLANRAIEEIIPVLYQHACITGRRGTDSP